MPTVLVLGGTGFIGRNFVEYFASLQEWEITATHFTRTPWNYDIAKWIKVDLRKEEEVTRTISNFDVVIQAAATTSGINDGIKRPDLHMTDNVIMNALILRRVSQVSIKNFVFFSCTTMLRSTEVPQSETDFNPSDEMYPAYFGVGWTKVYIEKLCEFYSRQNGNSTKFHVVRHSNVYGPYDKFDLEKSHVFGASITKVMEADDHVTIWGTGKERRDLIFVDDLIKLVDLAIKKQSLNFSIFNCGGDFISIADLVKKIIEASGRTHLEVRYDTSKPTVSFETTLDCSYASENLGWHRTISLDEGIRRTLDFWKTK